MTPAHKLTRRSIAFAVVAALLTAAPGCMQMKTQRVTLEHRDSVVQPEPVGQAIVAAPSNSATDPGEAPGR